MGLLELVECMGLAEQLAVHPVCCPWNGRAVLQYAKLGRLALRVR